MTCNGNNELAESNPERANQVTNNERKALHTLAALTIVRTSNITLGSVCFDDIYIKFVGDLPNWMLSFNKTALMVHVLCRK